jgi:hypothetical protein
MAILNSAISTTVVYNMAILVPSCLVTGRYIVQSNEGGGNKTAIIVCRYSTSNHIMGAGTNGDE